MLCSPDYIGILHEILQQYGIVVVISCLRGWFSVPMARDWLGSGVGLLHKLSCCALLLVGVVPRLARGYADVHLYLLIHY
jgi:hypothetical protein